MIDGGGNAEGGDEAGRRWEGLQARWCYFSTFTMFLWDFAADSTWTFTLGERERMQTPANIPTTYQTYHFPHQTTLWNWWEMKRQRQENDARVPTNERRLLTEWIPHTDTGGKKTMSTRARTWRVDATVPTPHPHWGISRNLMQLNESRLTFYGGAARKPGRQIYSQLPCLMEWHNLGTTKNCRILIGNLHYKRWWVLNGYCLPTGPLEYKRWLANPNRRRLELLWILYSLALLVLHPTIDDNIWFR